MDINSRTLPPTIRKNFALAVKNKEIGEQLSKLKFANAFMPEWSYGGQVICGMWSWNMGVGYMSPKMGLLENARNGLQPTPTELVNDYVQIMTGMGVCPFYTYLTNADVRKWDYLQGLTGDFIRDTLNYIAGNKRLISISNFEYLFLDDARMFGADPIGFEQHQLGIKENYECLKGLSFAEFFTLWLSRSGGWQDMILSKQAIIEYRPTAPAE